MRTASGVVKPQLMDQLQSQIMDLLIVSNRYYQYLGRIPLPKRLFTTDIKVSVEHFLEETVDLEGCIFL